jgi:hypothetical protein
MMVFKIPKNICKGITDTSSQFWWGDNNDRKKSIGRRGGSFANPNKKEVWDFEICIVSILQC